MSIKRVLNAKQLVSGDRGSLTVEAALIFPFFLAFMIGMVNFINIAVVYIAMDHAVSETVKQVAAHSYPLKHLTAAGQTGPGLAAAGQTGPGQAVPGQSGDIALLNELLAPVIKHGSGALPEKTGRLVLENGLKTIAAGKIREICPLEGISNEDFAITRVRMYNPWTVDDDGRDTSEDTVNGIVLDNEDIAVTVEYSVRLVIPFFPGTLTMSNTAVERVWADD